MAELQKLHEEYKERLHRARQDHEAVLTANKAEIAQLSTRLRDKEHQIAVMQQQIHKNDERIEELEEASAAKNAQLQELSEELARVEHERNKFAADVRMVLLSNGLTGYPSRIRIRQIWILLLMMMMIHRFGSCKSGSLNATRKRAQLPACLRKHHQFVCVYKKYVQTLLFTIVVLRNGKNKTQQNNFRKNKLGGIQPTLHM